ncbi:MAG: DUF932 domain-containing protein [Candidatus Methylumidiphilus sp.]
MAHNIGQMFYYGDTPWHTLGKKILHPATVDEALAAGGLNWEVGMVPLLTDEFPPSPVTTRRAVVRTDRKPGESNRVIGVVHPGFKPLQNRQGAKLFDSLFGKGERVYHTGGYLGQGEVVWLLAKLPENITVQGEDVLETYLLFTNSHDGSIAIDIRLTTVRVVCQNTLSMALKSGAKKHMFRRAHQGSYELLQTEAAEFFQFATQQAKETQALFQSFSAKECAEAKFRDFLKTILPDPALPATARKNPSVKKAHESRLLTIQQNRDAVMHVHLQGIPSRKILPAPPNWWGALNSVTAWVDHVQSTDSDHYAHILFGTGDQLKSSALEKIRAEVEA